MEMKASKGRLQRSLQFVIVISRTLIKNMEKFSIQTKKKEMVLCYQNCSIDQKTLLKFETEGQELAKILRSLEQFLQTVNGQNLFFGNRMLFYLFLDVSKL